MTSKSTIKILPKAEMTKQRDHLTEEIRGFPFCQLFYLNTIKLQIPSMANP